jgi:hypothetical protein
MAPIHHHFELKAWSETKIILRFWIITAIGAAIGFTIYAHSLKSPTPSTQASPAVTGSLRQQVPIVSGAFVSCTFGVCPHGVGCHGAGCGQ